MASFSFAGPKSAHSLRSRSLFKTFADQAVIAIENVRLFQELEARTRELAQSVEELQALGEVGQAVSSTLDLQTVLSTIVRHAVQLSRTDGGVIYEYDEAEKSSIFRASYHMEAESCRGPSGDTGPLGQGATGRAATMRAPIQLPDILKRARIHWYGSALFMHGLGIDLFWRFRFFEKSESWGR